jgi:DeoR/GlpR family transcriptional regulator of sugar metabolism
MAIADENGIENFNQAERQAWITQYILENGTLQVDDLAERLAVSRMTIHRDLDELERQGVLRKVRNGATATPSSLFESDVRFRLTQQTLEKEAIARAALAYIEPGQAILLDEATTLLPLARRLPELAPLTVITNFLPILNALRHSKDIHLISLGGEYLPRFDTFTGWLCETSLAALHADLYLTSTTAVSRDIAYHPEQQIVSAKRAMMACTSQHYLLLDHTKFGKTALHQVARLSEFEAVIVDGGLEGAQLAELRQLGVKVEVADTESV